MDFIFMLTRHDQTVEDCLAVFEAIRRWNLDLWARTPASERGRVGIHRERGPESYELTFRLAAGHDRIHLAQARRALEAARGQATKAWAAPQTMPCSWRTGSMSAQAAGVRP